MCMAGVPGRMRPRWTCSPLRTTLHHQTSTSRHGSSSRRTHLPDAAPFTSRQHPSVSHFERLRSLIRALRGFHPQPDASILIYQDLSSSCISSNLSAAETVSVRQLLMPGPQQRPYPPRDPPLERCLQTLCTSSCIIGSHCNCFTAAADEAAAAG